MKNESSESPRKVPEISDLLKVPDSESKVFSNKSSLTVGSPFIQNRKMFKIPDYNNPIYQEKEVDTNRSERMFRRTNFKINSDSR